MTELTYPVRLTQQEIRSLVSFLDLCHQQLGTTLPAVREKLLLIDAIVLHSPPAEAAGQGDGSPECGQGGAL
ncbi:hypothetical protein [Methylomarinovum tepidoasis]|uniref:hypothetical protein n=1 Tax=Methylomarinovum tepidoasis TaxID=2840183 RepID=UPI00257446C8|nr:hypothetical protein [Methylomarinovum sp. IN45]